MRMLTGSDSRTEGTKVMTIVVDAGSSDLYLKP